VQIQQFCWNLGLKSAKLEVIFKNLEHLRNEGAKVSKNCKQELTNLADTQK